MKKIYNIKVSTIIIVLLPILSILIGYFGVKFYLLSNNNFNDEIDSNRPGVEEIIEGNEEDLEDASTDSETINDNQSNNEISYTEKKVTNRIENINYYSIQVGSFSNEENANEFEKEFTDEGYFSYNLKNENYKVFVAASYDQETLEESLASVKSLSSDAFIKNIDLQSKNFSYVIDEKDYFLEISQLIERQINGINSSINLEDLKAQLNEIEKINAQFTKVNESNKDTASLITQYVSGLKNEMTTLNPNNEESIRKFLEKNINLFINFLR